jgi:hypothetical protein
VLLAARTLHTDFDHRPTKEISTSASAITSFAAVRHVTEHVKSDRLFKKKMRHQKYQQIKTKKIKHSDMHQDTKAEPCILKFQ